MGVRDEVERGPNSVHGTSVVYGRCPAEMDPKNKRRLLRQKNSTRLDEVPAHLGV